MNLGRSIKRNDDIVYTVCDLNRMPFEQQARRKERQADTLAAAEMSQGGEIGMHQGFAT